MGIERTIIPKECKKMKKNRLIGLLLALVMLVSVCTPASILADDAEPVDAEVGEVFTGEGEGADDEEA